MIAHRLQSRYWDEFKVVIPSVWQRDFGFVVVFGEPTHNQLVRIHSRCAYGDVFGSELCDCKDQLDKSMAMIKQEGGLLFYLEQEGRGAGNRVKAEAYQAFEQNRIDTFTFYEAQHQMRADLREYEPVASALREFGVASVRLLTNNPEKLTALADQGIAVARVPLAVEAASAAQPYLAAKRQRGHLTW